MRGDRTADTDALMGTYGLGRRAATRVVALLAKRVDVSGTLLAQAGSDEAAERFLLTPDLLRAAESLTQDSLRQRAADCGFDEADMLLLLTDTETGWRTIALEDDLLAAEATAAHHAAAAEHGAEGGQLVKAAPDQISVRETEGLFTPEETARLKLSVLTSQNPDERVESIRKLVFAPMDGAQKAGIFLTVLTDREAEPRVRREAIRSLEQIGFRSDMAEAVRGLFQEDAQEAVYAVQRLAALLRDADEGEGALVLAVVLEVFDQSRDAAIIRELLQLVARSAPVLVGNYQRSEQFCQSCIRHLARDFDELRSDIEAALRACGQAAPGLTADLFWRELDRADSPRVRALLLTMLEAISPQPVEAAEAARLAGRAVDEILNRDLPESEKGRLRYALVRVGEPAVREALARMAEAPGVERAELIRLVDVLCTESDVSTETVRRAVDVLLDLLKLADVLTRRSVLGAALLGDPRVEPGVQHELAAELLNLMTELSLPGSLDMIQSLLERIGPAALRPAHEFMRREHPSEPADRAAQAAARIVETTPDDVPDDLAAEMLDLCERLLSDEDGERGSFTLALAAVCGYTPPGAERFDPVLRRLMENVWRFAYTVEALTALGIMAGSANATAAHQEELFALFDGIVRFQGHGGMGVRRETDEGLVYEFGREIDFDIRVVPAAVKGLERMCLSDQASQQMRAEIVKRFLILWEGVSKVRVVWGPAGVDSLVGAMCSAACSPAATSQMKERLGHSLLRFLNKISVVRSIGLMCAQADDSPRMRDLMLEAGGEVLQEWETSDLQDDERRLALLDSAGRIAGNPVLPGSDERVRRLRERTLAALYSGLREGMTQVRRPLLFMRDCPDLTPDQKREIDERLSKAFGLVRIGGQD